VQELHEREHRLEHQAFHDPLTGLANRLLFTDRTQQALRRQQRSGRPLALMVCDLDDFKAVNDTLGHDAGDELLEGAASRLRRCVREVDTIARLGGDEFAVLLEDVTDPYAAHRTATRMLKALEEPIRVGDRDIGVRASIGLVLSALDGVTSDALLRNADVALYKAKSAGKHCISVFEGRMLDDVVAKLALRTDLTAAIANPGQLHLHYQPIIDLSTGTFTGVEALVRWRHPTRGLLYPGSFIETAEETGDIVALGAAALHEACRQAVSWEQAGVSCPTMAVNLSARQLHDRAIVSTVQAALEESGLPASALVLEITESVTLDGATKAIERLHQLKELGIGLAIDDFGTGYSSLEYLRRLPVDTLKIDRSFIMEIDASPAAAVLVDAVINLAHTLGLETIVEGIETVSQLDTVRGIGSDQAQGYFIAMPAPAEEIGPLLQAGVFAVSQTGS
jgi:diguanylate cyclase (GGDEF)-like protein